MIQNKPESFVNLFSPNLNSYLNNIDGKILQEGVRIRREQIHTRFLSDMNH